jgi:hypothetical protein
MGNYKPKTYDGQIDGIIIKIADNDDKKLKQYSQLILNVERSLSKPIEINTNFETGLNKTIKLKINKESLFKASSEIYFNDIMQLKLFSNQITFVNKFSQPVVNPNPDTVSNALNNFVTKFLLMVSKDHVSKMALRLNQEKDKLLFSDLGLQHMIMSLITNSNVVTKSGDQNPKQPKPLNEKQKFYELIVANKLELTPPFCGYKYFCKMMDPNDASISIDDIMTSLDNIKQNMSYWNDLNNVLLAKLTLTAIDTYDTEKKYLNKIRLLQYICESEYGY